MVIVKNPLTLSLLLLLLACGVGLFIAYRLRLWAINAVILIFLGGIIIIFLYVSTLRRGDKVFNFVRGARGFLWTALLILGYGWKPESLEPALLYSNNMLEFRIMFKSLNVGLLVFLFRYLLVTLFRVVKLSESFKGALIKTK